MCQVRVKRDAVYCWNCKSDQSKCRPLIDSGHLDVEKFNPQNKIILKYLKTFGKKLSFLTSF